MIQHTKNQLKKFTKSDIIIDSLIPLMLISICFLGWQGRNFPDKAQVQYMEGYILSVDNKSYAANGALLLQDSRGDTRYLGCEYGVIIKRRTATSCMTYDEATELFGKKATVGWYYDKGVLGIQPTTPNQLVSLAIDGEHLITYEDRLELMKRRNDFNISFVLVTLPLYLLYVIYTKK